VLFAILSKIVLYLELLAVDAKKHLIPSTMT
jgi:hypothetical protein